MKRAINAASVAAVMAVASFLVPGTAHAQVSVSATWITSLAPQPSARGGPSMSYDLLHRETVVFGGSSSYLADTWTFDGTTWTQLQVSGPSGRYLAPMVYDSARGVAVLFGGYNFNGILADTWEWNGSTWTQKFPLHSPPRRLWTAMAYDSPHHLTVLFGGATGTGLLNDTWVYDGNDWTQVTTVHSPPARRGLALAFDSARSRTVLFGGQDPAGVNLNDTWEFDGTDWTQVFTAHTPAARLWHSMAYDASLAVTVVFGGAADPNVPFADTWLYDGVDWQQLPPSGPNSRLQAAMAYDPNRGELIQFGGAENIAYNPQLADTVVLRGVATSAIDWGQANSSPAPSARVFAAMDYDSARGVSVLFSGSSDGGPGTVADTWEWNGSSWLQRSPATSPPAEAGATMAYDSARGFSVLFGGDGAAGLSSSTWEWDGTSWTQRAFATAPSARTFAAMAYDSAHKRMVLFGGDSGNDTWVYDGTAWTQVFPTSSPSQRLGPAMAYDPTRGRIVLFGGRDANGQRLADTWEWDGADWTQVATTTAPYPRFWSSLAFDSQRGKLVLFGGDHIQPFSLGEENDTWEWDGNQWIRDWTAAAPPRRAGHSMDYDQARGRMVLFGGFNPATSPGTFYGDTWELGADIQTPAGNPSASLLNGVTDFGNVNLGSTSFPTSFGLTSTGTGPLTIGSITTTGDFAVSSTDCPSSANVLASGSFCITVVTFTPTAAGLRTGTLTIGSFSVSLQGTGVLLPTSITVASSVGLFNTSATLTARLTSNGSALSGEPVRFQLPTGVSATFQTNAQGVATWAGASLSGIHVGSYTTGIQATFAGASGLAASSATGALTVTQPVSMSYTGDFFVADSAGAHLAVSIDQRTPSSDRQFLDYATTSASVRFSIGASVFVAPITDAPDWTTSGLGVASVDLPALPDGAYTVTTTLAGDTLAGDDVRVGLVSSPTKGGYLSGGGAIAADPSANTSDTHGYFSLQMEPSSAVRGNLVYVYRVNMYVGNGNMRDVDIWVTSTDITSLSGKGPSATATGHYSVEYVDAETGARYTSFEFAGGVFKLTAVNATTKAPAGFALVLVRPDGTIFHATAPVNEAGNASAVPVVLGSLQDNL